MAARTPGPEWEARVEQRATRRLAVHSWPHVVLAAVLLPAWVVLAFTNDAWFVLWGVPFLAASLWLNLRAGRLIRMLDDDPDPAARARHARRARWIPILAWACLLVGFAGPFWVDGATS